MRFYIEEANEDHFLINESCQSNTVFDGIDSALAYLRKRFRPLESELKATEQAGARDLPIKLANP